MTVIDISPLLSDRTVQFEDQLARRPVALPYDGERWLPPGEGQRLALERLRKWITDPATLDHDEIEPPSPSMIQAAIGLLGLFRNQQLPEGFFPVPDGKGGICFERKSAPIFEEYDLEKTGALSYRRYVDGRLIHKSVLGWMRIPPAKDRS